MPDTLTAESEAEFGFAGLEVQARMLVSGGVSSQAPKKERTERRPNVEGK
jgi:hypothetical protein